MTIKAHPPRFPVRDNRRVPPPPKSADAVYLTPEWRALLARILAARGRQCEQCGRTGCRIYGDHVIELRDGGPVHDPSNIRLLCASCHTTKTRAEAGRRMAQRF